VGVWEDFTDAPQNIAFTLLGWYSAPDDFGQAICDAVNCGFDTDCTGATLGSILGIAWGAARLPKRWMEPLGESIAIIAERTRLTDVPRTLGELTDRTAAVAIGSLAGQGYAFGPGKSIELELPTPEELRAQMQAAGLWHNAKDEVERAWHHGRVRLTYPAGPLLAPGARNEVRVAITNTTERTLEGPISAASLSAGLKVALRPRRLDLAPGETARLTLEAALEPADAPCAHVEAVIGVQAEGTAPFTFPVSFVRPMTWRIQARPDGEGEPQVTGGELLAVGGNSVPLPGAGTWVGVTRVLNPSARPRPVRICAPSNAPVCIWLNGSKVVDNPGSERIMPSYHCNAAHHYGEGVLAPGWNSLTARWQWRGEGETHLFLTTPDGAGWGDLVFEAPEG
jgi:hypothetical protein